MIAQRAILLPLVFLLAGCAASAQTASPSRRTAATRPAWGEELLPAGAIARLGASRMRHGGRIRSLVFSPDGDMLATGGDDATVRLWSMYTGRQLGTHSKLYSSVESLSFHPDGDKLAAGIRDNNDVFFLLHVGGKADAMSHPARRAKDREGWLGPVVYSPSGEFMAGADGQGNLVLWYPHWDARIRKEPRSIGKCSAVKQILFSPDSRRVATREGKATVHLFDVRGRKMLFALAVKEETISALVFSPDGKHLLTGGGTRETAIRFWDAETGQQTCVLKHDNPRGGVSSLALSPDGRTLAVSSAGEVYLWNVNAAKPSRALARVGDGAVVEHLQFSPDGARLAGAAGNTVCLWHTASGRLYTPGPTEAVDAITATITAVAASPDRRLLAAGSENGRIDLWDLPARRLLRRLPGHAEAVARLTFSPDGKMLASRSSSGVIRLWDADSGRQRREIQSPPIHPRTAIDLLYAPNGKMLAADYLDLLAKEAGILLWDAESGREIQNLRKASDDAGWISLFAFSATGDRLWAVTTTKTSYSWRFGEGRFVLGQVSPAFAGKDRFPLGFPAAFSADGVLVAVESSRGGLHIPDRERPRAPAPPGSMGFGGIGWGVSRHNPSPPVTRLAVSPDGRYVLGETSSNVFHVYEMASGQEVLLRKLPDRVKFGPLAFTADGRNIVSGMADGTLLVWDVFASEGIRGGRVAELWADLKDDFAGWAHLAVSGMIEAGDEAVVFLDGKVQPAAGPKAEELSRLIVELDSDRFVVRERASKQLAKAGEAARTALERARSDKPTLEVRRRIDALLASLDEFRPNGFLGDPETLRRLRAVIVLAHIDTPAARRLLRRLSDGGDDSFTSEVKAALKRLPPTPPAPLAPSEDAGRKKSSPPPKGNGR
ncbi:MAG TPA: WD40 repeat domain-containing protein [Gemmataceae bacterium]|jgi:WD40 repeat protein